MRYAFVIILCLVALVSCKAPKDSASYELKIVYNLLYDTLGGDYEIYIMNLDGTDQKNISNSISTDWTYHSYKDRIFFISDRDTTAKVFFLYEMDPNGNNVRKISDLRLHDSWMSSRNEGKEMVVSGRIGTEVFQQLFLIDIKTGTYSQITHDTAAMFVDPLFSPDGQKIFFRYRKNKRNPKNEKAEIWSMNADGSNLNQVTQYPTTDSTSVWFSYHAGPPQWHPGDSTQSFISYQSFQNKRSNLYRIDPQGGDSQLILDHERLFAGWHNWSPDGKWLAIDMYDNIKTEYDIYLLNWETREFKRLTDRWELEYAPNFVQVKK